MSRHETALVFFLISLSIFLSFPFLPLLSPSHFLSPSLFSNRESLSTFILHIFYSPALSVRVISTKTIFSYFRILTNRLANLISDLIILSDTACAFLYDCENILRVGWQRLGRLGFGFSVLSFSFLFLFLFLFLSTSFLNLLALCPFHSPPPSHFLTLTLSFKDKRKNKALQSLIPLCYLLMTSHHRGIKHHWQETYESIVFADHPRREEGEWGE